MNNNPFTGNFADKTREFKPKRFFGKLILILVAIAILSLLSTCWYTVDEKEQAVILTFGEVTGTADAGIHFKLPFGMITGDYNIVNIDFFVEYKVSDPVKYLFASASPELILKNLVQSQIRNVVGSSTVDSVLTDGKAEIQSQIKDLISTVLEEYDIGLIVTDVKIQDSEPPTASVIEAFKAVETAKQGAETAINQAKAYENSELPKAQAEADKLIQNAEYLKQNRINEATKQVAKFNAMYEEYAKNPDITRTRMYYEMITETLPGVKLYIDAGDGDTAKLLPLESFNGTVN